MSEYDGFLAALSGDEVGVLEPEGGETTFALAQRIARAGKRAERTVNSWAVDGKLYFSASAGSTAVEEPATRLEIGKKPRGRAAK
ncbi:hypothetical protein AYO38_05645 [bacterium SCGC AG-212-C10]|nr:hypothetical protein AYO38_05645 [bacterium SCGC AG-212-C10]